MSRKISPKRIKELGKMLEKVLREHPEADRDTVWRFLRDLEDTPEERLWR
ncbi:hypothetical protein HY256_03550, partial [Candidatus Sumerlaeota bacterium]|nr:hypothetical protein [Candidatus Sumerlaeota bacterium]